MTIHADIKMTPAQFSTWCRANPNQRAELSKGRLQMMNEVSLGHARLVRRVATLLAARFSDESHDIATDAFGVEPSSETVRFPDVVLFPRQGDPSGRRAEAPLLIVEVLSTWSMARDLREKPNEYLALPSLQSYLVLSSTDVAAWLWVRGEAGFEAEPTLIEGAGAAIEIPALGFAATLGAVYTGTGIG